jgi:hypothetical protein
VTEQRKEDPVVQIQGWCAACFFTDRGIAKLSHLKLDGWNCPRCKRPTLVLKNLEA